MTHQFSMRVYIEDTDMGGIVYHANYLKYAERARTEMLRDAGIEQSALKKDLGLVFVVRKMDLDYLAPALFDDMLTIETSLYEMKGSSFVLTQKIMRGEQVLFKCNVVVVTVDGNAMKPARTPEIIRKALGA